ncbi:hypothetical protein HYV11_01560 [Candidatus Dependentiae bacterium]|nr:hypothetical protein [Candidatus Dependentiae bacterium]
MLKHYCCVVDHEDRSGKTAMDYAVYFGNKKIIKRLLKENAAVTTDQNLDYLKNFLRGRTRRFGIVSGIFGAFAGVRVLSDVFFRAR